MSNQQMSIADIIEQLMTSSRQQTPVSAMLTAVKQWHEMQAVIAELMQLFIEQPEQFNRAQHNALFYCLLLVVQQQDQQLMPLFIKLIDQDDDIETPLDELFGDSLTEDLSTMLLVLMQGQHEPLFQLLDSQQAGFYVKTAVITALFAQYEMDACPRETIIHVIDQCLAAYPNPENEDQILFISELACLCLHYQFSEYQAAFLTLFAENKLDADFISLDDLETWSFPAVLGLAGGAVSTEFNAIDYLQSRPSFLSKKV